MKQFISDYWQVFAYFIGIITLVILLMKNFFRQIEMPNEQSEIDYDENSYH